MGPFKHHFNSLMVQDVSFVGGRKEGKKRATALLSVISSNIICRRSAPLIR